MQQKLVEHAFGHIQLQDRLIPDCIYVYIHALIHPYRKTGNQLTWHSFAGTAPVLPEKQTTFGKSEDARNFRFLNLKTKSALGETLVSKSTSAAPQISNATNATMSHRPERNSPRQVHSDIWRSVKRGGDSSPRRRTILETREGRSTSFLHLTM